MATRLDPFSNLDRIAAQLFATTSRPAGAALDVYRDGDAFYIELDLPGVDPGSIDATLERNVLTVRAERRRARREGVEHLVAERPAGVVTRRILLGDGLDSDRLEADYDAGVLTVRIPVADTVKARRIAITTGGGREELAAA